MRWLGVDQARTSGWALLEAQGSGLVLLDWGLARRAADRQAAVGQLRAAYDEVAMEQHAFGPKRAVLSLHQTAGRWLEHLELAGYAEARVAWLSPGQWRRKLGAPRWEGNKDQRRKAAKAWAVEEAARRYGLQLPDDAAEAALIGTAASMLPSRSCNTSQSSSSRTGTGKAGSARKSSRSGTRSSGRKRTTKKRTTS